jgi:hypothetical protein
MLRTTSSKGHELINQVEKVWGLSNRNYMKYKVIISFLETYVTLQVPQDYLSLTRGISEINQFYNKAQHHKEELERLESNKLIEEFFDYFDRMKEDITSIMKSLKTFATLDEDFLANNFKGVLALDFTLDKRASELSPEDQAML